MQDRTADRLLYALKARGPQTAAALAKRLKITPVAVRQLLARLTSDSLVQHEDRREGVGRPKRHWRLTAAGHARFPDNHAGLTAELLDSVGAVFGEKGLEQLISHREAATLAAYRAALRICEGTRRARRASRKDPLGRGLHGAGRSGRRCDPAGRKPLPDLRRGEQMPGLLPFRARDLPRGARSARDGRAPGASDRGRQALRLSDRADDVALEVLCLLRSPLAGSGSG